MSEAGTKALCEVKKEALNALARIGKFANLDVDASVQTKEMKICIKDFNLSTGLEHLQFALDIQGSAEAKVNVNFVPLDFAGQPDLRNGLVEGADLSGCVTRFADRNRFTSAVASCHTGFRSHRVNLKSSLYGVEVNHWYRRVAVVQPHAADRCNCFTHIRIFQFS